MCKKLKINVTQKNNYTQTRLISLVLFLALLLCTLTACGSKTPQTPAGFTKKMKEAKFEVQDVTADIESNETATTILIATNENYQIEYFELTDNDTGEGVFYNNKQIFDDEHSVKTLSTELSYGNYDYYSFSADGDFHLIARIDNTMLYCVAKKDYKEEIVDLVKKLGYK